MNTEHATQELGTSFRRQAGLALIGGLFTVIVAPTATFLIEHTRWKIEQETFAERARLEIIADARRQFLHDFSDVCWSLQLAMIDVPFSRQFSEEGFDKACKRYDMASPDLFGRLRALSEGAIWFTTDANQQKIDTHIEWLLGRDMKLLQLRSNGDIQSEWQELHRELFDQTKSKTRSLIQVLADEYQVIARD